MRMAVVVMVMLILGGIGVWRNGEFLNCKHDGNLWHSTDFSGCVFTHDHGDDPNSVNDIFGLPGSWYGEKNKEISYPWQTYKAPENIRHDQVLNHVAEMSSMENHMKHEGYFWEVKRDLPCKQNYCVRAFRIMYHNHPTMDMNVRWHSASFEAYVCKDGNDNNTCGTIRTGGWFDFGYLFKPAGEMKCEDLLKNKEMRNKYRVDTDFDEQFMETDFNLDSDLVDEFRCHFSDKDLIEWWGHGGSDVRFQLTIDQGKKDVNIGYFLPVNLYYVDGYINDRVVNLPLGKRYINRFGKINNECLEVGLDCIPIEYSNIYLSGDIAKEVVGFTQQTQ